MLVRREKENGNKNQMSTEKFSGLRYFLSLRCDVVHDRQHIKDTINPRQVWHDGWLEWVKIGKKYPHEGPLFRIVERLFIAD